MTEPWQSLKFIDIVDYTKKPRNLNLPKLIPFVPMDLVPLEKTKILECNYVESVSSGTYVEDGDLLLAKITPSFENGKQGILSIGHDFAYATTEVIPLKGKLKVALTDYIALFLKRSEIRGYLAGKMEGSTGRQRLSKSALDDLSVSIPHITEQAKIVFVLNMIQTAIEQQDKLIKTTTELKKALMQKLFTEGTKGEKRKQTEIGLVPESWILTPIEKLCTGNFQNGAFVKDPDKSAGLLFVNVVDMYSGIYINFNKLERININENAVQQYLLKENDILFVRSSLKREGIGQNCIIKNLAEKAFYDCHLIKITPEIKKVVPEFLSYYFSSAVGKEELIKRSKTTTMTTINQKSLGSTLIPLPDQTEQTQIVAAGLAIDKKIQFHEQKKQTQTALFKTLLHELMTRQRRVHEIDFGNLEKEVAADDEAN